MAFSVRKHAWSISTALEGSLWSSVRSALSHSPCCPRRRDLYLCGGSWGASHRSVTLFPSASLRLHGYLLYLSRCSFASVFVPLLSLCPCLFPCCCTVSVCRAVSLCAVLCRAVPCRAVPCRAVPCRAVPCRGVAWRGVAWRGVAWRGVAWRGVAWRCCAHAASVLLRVLG